MNIVSEGTLRPEDLLPAFRDELDTRWKMIDPATNMCNDLLQVSRVLSQADHLIMAQNFESDSTSMVLNDLQTALTFLAPEGTYFGAHEGDGACFGYWEISDID